MHLPNASRTCWGGTPQRIPPGAASFDASRSATSSASSLDTFSSTGITSNSTCTAISTRSDPSQPRQDDHASNASESARNERPDPTIRHVDTDLACQNTFDGSNELRPSPTIHRDDRYIRRETPTKESLADNNSKLMELLLDASKPKPKPTPTTPYRVLDAPALRDDYYCSLLAYSETLQCLAVGLGPHVYLWCESRATARANIPDSLTAPRGSSHVTSVSFSSVSGGSAILAIGRGDGRITLWSPLDPDPRFDSEQPSPVSYVCFRPTTNRRRSIRDPVVFVDTEELLVGDEVGNVYFYSVEWPDQDQRDLFNWHGSMTLLARITGHTQQICGVAWNPDGKLFATGGNDNNVLLFETNKVLAATAGKPKHTFALNAACKAIAFAPWHASLLAAGGGSNDRCIHFFHALSGAKLAKIDCHAQVTSLVFNPRRRQIAATFGFAQPEHPYRIAVFAWPSCSKIVCIPWWGEERALYAVEYPGLGGSLVVATSDASIKFHEVWPGKDGAKGNSGGKGVLGSPILDDELLIERDEAIR
jgi:meiosis-specific APC/C activator protein AMA1